MRVNQTDAEAKLWRHLRRKSFCGLKFARQYGVGPYILDFFCCRKKVAVEVDGGQHNTEDGRDYDQIRSEYLKCHDIRVIRFWNNEVLQNIEAVLETIEREMTTNTRPSPTLPYREGDQAETDLRF